MSVNSWGGHFVIEKCPLIPTMNHWRLHPGEWGCKPDFPFRMGLQGVDSALFWELKKGGKGNNLMQTPQMWCFKVALRAPSIS